MHFTLIWIYLTLLFQKDVNAEKMHLFFDFKNLICSLFHNYIFYLPVHSSCPKGIGEPVDLANDNGNAPEEYNAASEIQPGIISLSSCPTPAYGYLTTFCPVFNHVLIL